MQLSATSTKNGLLQLCESLAGIGDGGITGNATLCAQFINYINMAYNDVVAAILDVDTTWKFDDFRYTDYPEAPITMVASQRDYTLPVASTGANVATLLRINKVWVLDSSGERHQLDLMDNDEDFDYTSTGLPTKYRVDGKSIMLNPRPSASACTLTSGLIIKFERAPSPFAYSDLDGSKDSTLQPGFMSIYHPLLALRASAWYLMPIPEKQNVVAQYESRFLNGVEDLKANYAYMTDDMPTRLTPSKDSSR